MVLNGVTKFLSPLSFPSRNLDFKAITAKLLAFPFDNDALSHSNPELFRDTLVSLLVGSKNSLPNDFNNQFQALAGCAVGNFVDSLSSALHTYKSNAEAFNGFKEAFDVLMHCASNHAFGENSKSLQKKNFIANLETFWDEHESRLLTAYAKTLAPIVVPPSLLRSSFAISPAMLNVANQIEDLLGLDEQGTTSSNIPHAQLREYSQAYGDLVQGTLSESVLKLAINSANPGVNLDVASDAIPELERFIKHCLEADNIRLAERKDQNINSTEIKTLIKSPEAQENLNHILKAWGLEYDFKTYTLKQNAFIEQAINYLGDIAQLDISGLVAEQGSASEKVDNPARLSEIHESIVSRQDSSIKDLSFIGYPGAPASLVDDVTFQDLITKSNRSDLIIELPYSLEAFEKIQNLI